VTAVAKRLLQIEAQNFRSLRNVSLPLGPLNVLVGPGGAGKTNLLSMFRFLADVVDTDLCPALQLHGGFEHLAFWGGTRRPTSIRIGLRATWTARSSPVHPDEYELRIGCASGEIRRAESFHFGPPKGRGCRISVDGEKVSIADGRGGTREVGVNAASSGLSTLYRLGARGGRDVAAVARSFASFRNFAVGVDAARRPSRLPPEGRQSLDDDAGDLAAFLLTLRNRDADAWRRLVADAEELLPHLTHIDFDHPSGAAQTVAVVIRERGLRRVTQLADASPGTVRLLGLLAMLYDPEPPALTCVEEIDQGLHPQALEVLVARLREASERTQFLVTAYSPNLADRLKPEELIICERRDDGSSAIPAVSTARLERIVKVSEGLPLGNLWFSGALGGDL
jgi:predicted ATPase